MLVDYKLYAVILWIGVNNLNVIKFVDWDNGLGYLIFYVYLLKYFISHIRVQPFQFRKVGNYLQKVQNYLRKTRNNLRKKNFKKRSENLKLDLKIRN